MKTLKVWNGRGWGNQRRDKDGKIIPDPTGKEYCDHAYVCANSRSHAVRMINEVVGHGAVSDSELKVYWHEGCWGNAMEGIEKEIGIWTIQEHGDKPQRIL